MGVRLVNGNPPICWLVLQAKDSKYADIEGRAYEYPRHIPNAQRIGVGDLLVIALPKASAPDGRRVVGLGRVGAIQSQGSDRFIALYDYYVKLTKPASFEEIGGDPRKNQTNSINLIEQEIAKRLLAREGVADMESLPMISSERSMTARLSVGICNW